MAKIKLEGLTFSSGDVLQCEAIYAKMPGYNFPIGFIWYSQILVNVVNIGYVFTNENWRRHGIASAMVNQLQDWYPNKTICTAVGNHLSTPWLQANGFSKEPIGWFLRRPEPCPII